MLNLEFNGPESHFLSITYIKICLTLKKLECNKCKKKKRKGFFRTQQFAKSSNFFHDIDGIQMYFLNNLKMFNIQCYL